MNSISLNLCLRWYRRPSLAFYAWPYLLRFTTSRCQLVYIGAQLREGYQVIYLARHHQGSFPNGRSPVMIQARWSLHLIGGNREPVMRERCLSYYNCTHVLKAQALIPCSLKSTSFMVKGFKIATSVLVAAFEKVGLTPLHLHIASKKVYKFSDSR
jgi:hypothetical protein